MTSELQMILQAGVGLLDLPNEILNFIVCYLENDDLLHLAMMSKRLHIIALSLHIHRSIPNFRDYKSINFVSGPPSPVLPALRLALFITELKFLIISFKPEGRSTAPSLRGLERLLRRISCIEDLMICFSDFGIEGTELQPLELLTKVLGALVSKGCHRLAIRHCRVQESLVAGKAENGLHMLPNKDRPVSPISSVPPSPLSTL